jgi:hypothetical protein
MTAMPDTLKARANQWREVDAVRQHAAGWGGSGGAARWWTNLDLSIKDVLLCFAGIEDTARYIEAPWAALPDGLQSSLALNVRAMRRALAGCTWR